MKRKITIFVESLIEVKSSSYTKRVDYDIEEPLEIEELDEIDEILAELKENLEYEIKRPWQ